MPRRFRLWMMLAFTALCALAIWPFVMVYPAMRQRAAKAQNQRRQAAYLQQAARIRAQQPIRLQDRLMQVGPHYIDPRRISRVTDRNDGSILVDLEGSRESILLDGADAAAFRKWLDLNSTPVDPEASSPATLAVEPGA